MQEGKGWSKIFGLFKRTYFMDGPYAKIEHIQGKAIVQCKCIDCNISLFILVSIFLDKNILI